MEDQLECNSQLPMGKDELPVSLDHSLSSTMKRKSQCEIENFIPEKKTCLHKKESRMLFNDAEKCKECQHQSKSPADEEEDFAAACSKDLHQIEAESSTEICEQLHAESKDALLEESSCEDDINSQQEEKLISPTNEDNLLLCSEELENMIDYQSDNDNELTHPEGDVKLETNSLTSNNTQCDSSMPNSKLIDQEPVPVNVNFKIEATKESTNSSFIRSCEESKIKQEDIRNSIKHLSLNPPPPQESKKKCYSRSNPAHLHSWLETFRNWSSSERMMALDHLIEISELSQVRHMMNVIEPQFQRDFISLLPKELALYVLSFLGPRDLLRAAQTCRYWRILAEDNLLWREKCREAGMEADVYESLSQQHEQQTTGPNHWKAAFMRQHSIEMNWRYHPIVSPKVLKGHDDHVITCLQFSGTKIVSGSDDNTLKVWSAITSKCLWTLVGHTGGVWSSQMAGSVIISGSTDRTLKVWNADTGQCVHTLYGHTSTVRCMHLHQNVVVSGSRDATLRVWNVTTGACEHVLVGHVAAVRCVQYNGKLVVSGAYDYMVKIWNPDTEECLYTLQGHTNRVYSLQFDGTHVVSGSLDTSIRVWDAETGASKHTLMGHQSLTSGMELKNNILVSGNADSTVKVWDILTGQCLQTLAGTNKHQSAVTCLQFNSKFVVTSSDDGTVKLWDLKTGEFIRNLVALESGGSGGVVWRIKTSGNKLVCAVGSRNGTEETKLLVLDFDIN